MRAKNKAEFNRALINAAISAGIATAKRTVANIKKAADETLKIHDKFCGGTKGKFVKELESDGPLYAETVRFALREILHCNL
jgi:hypothetical protein